MATEEFAKRKAWPAIKNGLKCRCPKCGQGKLFHHYVETVERCSNCNEPLARYRVGLLLPFVIIMIVAHVLVFIMLEMELHGAASPLLYLIVLVPLSIIVPLAIMPTTKGGIIGILWARNLSDELES